MKRLVLFSHLTEVVLKKVFPLIFPASLTNKVLACMPCDGSLVGHSYDLFTSAWRDLAQQYHAGFVFINNTTNNLSQGIMKLQQANILLITGGNVCVLLRNLRASGLDRAILDFAQRDEYIIAGYSAGAMILSPTIRLAACSPDGNENADVGLSDFTALHLVESEIFPHYTPEYEGF